MEANSQPKTVTIVSTVWISRKEVADGCFLHNVLGLSEEGGKTLGFLGLL